jgi:type VI secretion system protein ImpG
VFNRYFQQEMSYLKDLGAEFAKAHPSLAPMLSGPTADPDVERLMEGVAFLTGLMRQKLDDDFPEIIHDLMQMFWPHYLRPVPSTTMIAFSPKPTLKQSATIPAGVSVASVPVEGTSCLFRTCYDVELHPLNLLDAFYAQPAGQSPVIKLLLELSGLRVSAWQPKSLRIFLAGDYANATDIYFLLMRHLKRIVIKPVEKGESCFLSPEFLKPAGFSDNESLIPYPSHSYPGYRILQEYFIQPEKFLFVDLTGLQRWVNGGDGSKFEISFELDDVPFLPLRVKKDNFVFSVTPAINIFPHEADPISLDHRKTQYLVRPSGPDPEHHEVFSVDRVVGFVQGTAEERRYVPFEFFNQDTKSSPAYHIAMKESPVRSGVDVYLSVAYPPDAGPPSYETISVYLTCTNGPLPESLRPGDISRPTGSSPEFAEFQNIRPPTANVMSPIGTNLLWRLLSHLSLNYLSLARTENLKALLELYISPGIRNHSALLANRKRINGIEGVEAGSADRLVSGIMMRGQEIRMKLRQDHFASQGDMFLFGCILDHFLGGYASINTYTSLNIQEVSRGEEYRWPAKLGHRPLI